MLEVSLRISRHLRFRFIGANDDPNYEIRNALKREDAAKRSRKYRAARSTSGKRGRPALQLSDAEKLQRQRAQDAERARRHRASRKNASRDISKIRTRDGLKRDVESRTNKDFDERAQARVGQQTKDSIGVTSDIPSKNQSLAGLPIGAGAPIHAAIVFEEPIGQTVAAGRGGVGRPAQPPRTRIRRTFRPTHRQREIAHDMGVPTERVNGEYETFKYWGIASGAYSGNWDEAWRRWIIKTAAIDDAMNAWRAV
ncbi:hypothetical protein CT676_35965 [Bradyrhizobium sp. MOS001]|uniref:hypothetical protein n=1 Tax=Bradyrhizobium sp. MOS001 TaxID=2133948 RepID=UPI001074DBE7|nr:hypothetical protein [Bradyrhizobium sp. MOS001]TFW56257.1 hypothetical protein CT676_35965 [Bradyrhizobium sp. MOS001]